MQDGDDQPRAQAPGGLELAQGREQAAVADEQDGGALARRAGHADGGWQAKADRGEIGGQFQGARLRHGHERQHAEEVAGVIDEAPLGGEQAIEGEGEAARVDRAVAIGRLEILLELEPRERFEHVWRVIGRASGLPESQACGLTAA